MERPPSLSVFVPAHNEARNLEGAVRDVVAAASATCPDYEILLVDDGSMDGTAEVADRLARDNPRIRVIHHPTKQGLAAGYRAALGAAAKDYFGFVPGDGEIHVDSIRAIFGAIGSADLVVPYHANREARAWHRRVLTVCSTGLINLLFRDGLRYYQGPTVYPIALARSLPVRSRGFFFVAEMLLHALDRGASHVEVGLRHRERAFGKSKAVNVSNIATALQTVLGTWWVLRVRRPPLPAAAGARPGLGPDRGIAGRVVAVHETRERRAPGGPVEVEATFHAEVPRDAASWRRGSEPADVKTGGSVES